MEASRGAIETEHAVNALLRLTAEAPGELSIVAHMAPQPHIRD